MPDEIDRPLLNPVLQLKMESRRETPTGGGKGRNSVIVSRLPTQQRFLSSTVRQLYGRRSQLQAYGGRTHLLVQMFAEDSLAPSWAPGDLFSRITGCQLVAPYRHGYVVEASVNALPELAAAIDRAAGFAVQTDISRVENLAEFGMRDRLRERSVEQLWNAAPQDDDGRRFIVWFAPYRDQGAREHLLQQVDEMSNRLLLPTLPLLQIGTADAASTAVAQPRQSSIARAMRTYRNTGIGRAVVRVTSPDALGELAASGVSHRIDPIRRVDMSAPGEGTEPNPPLPAASDPIVGVVDGGLHASSYKPLEAWKAAPLVPDRDADRVHGNAISSLVVQGHAWNANRVLPALHCRLGTVQAVPRERHGGRVVDERDLIDYLAAVVRAHPETKVWNISANQAVEDGELAEVSFLGHELNELARAANILPVISIGNVRGDTQTQLCPPADCEASITVGGRGADRSGMPGDACPHCVSGPGPDGMLKPDVSWFSQLRMLGGAVATGSSYPTALVSSVAAHTFDSLREPTPDLVKALLISAGERHSHDPKLGWGTPYNGHPPWTCEPGSVTLAWRAHLSPGTLYYWTDIPIPPEMIRNGKLYGRATLTAVLRPLISPLGGANYFASRLETALQYPRGGKGWHNLLGTMEESTLPEQEARDELKKWNPVRRHCRDFTRRGGIEFSGNHLRLYARVFTRDLYQFGWTHHSQVPEQEVAFVLKLWGGDSDSGIYNSMVTSLGNFVESALITQDIEIEN